MTHGESEPIGPKGRCPGLPGACEGDESSSFVFYSDGHGACFAGSCPKKYWSPKDLAARLGPDYLEGLDLEDPAPCRQPTERKAQDVDLQEQIDRGEFRALPKWKVLEETVKKADYRVYLNSKGEAIHVAVYHDEDGRPVDAKIRNAGKDGTGKDFAWAGSAKDKPLGNLRNLPPAGKKVVVVEGEKDGLSMMQLLTHVPVVWVPNGAGPQTKKDMARYAERLSRFDEVVLCFDPDEAGRTGMKECARLFPPGKVSLANLPSGMDVTELVQAGRAKDATGPVFHPEPFRPDGIVSAASLVGLALSPTQTGLSFGMKEVDAWTYGWRDGEVIVLGAGTGIGKTDFEMQVCASLIKPAADGGAETPCACFNYEASPVSTLKGIAGKIWERRFHIPGDHLWSENELRAAMDYLTEKCAKLFINDHFGATDWDAVVERSRYLAQAEGVKRVFVDPMAALVAAVEDERKGLDRLMAESKSVCEGEGLGMWFNSHLARPAEGKSHEEGGRVTLRNFRGSGAIAMWPSFVFALERNQQGDEEERAVTTLRVLKDRFTGDSTGKTLPLRYNVLTGMLEVERIPLVDDEPDGPGEVSEEEMGSVE